MSNYLEEAYSDAQDTVVEFLNTIIEQLEDYGEASDDLYNSYPDGDSYHHENHTDKCYSLLEAAQVLHDLSQFRETDKGLWEGLDPEQAIQVMAVYTYGNAVMSMWGDLINEINSEYEDHVDILDQKQAELEAKTELLESLETEAISGKLNKVKQATLDKLRLEADLLTPQSIRKDKEDYLRVMVKECLDS